MCVRTSRWRSQEEEEEERKNPRITKESLRRICKEQKLYITPHLNDVLYLHYKGYSKIENLEEYTGLKCLWLENNGIDKIENLDNQRDLRNLYLHNNLIKEIENLEDACPLLDSLNLCHNSVSKIQNLSKLEHLHTLHISHNRLQDFSDVEHLKECKELSCVDLQHNWLDDPNIVDIFEAMPSLRVLYLTGNPVVKKIPSYRKNLTVRCKNLTYLDDRPVFPKDRAAAEAWSEGGLDAEKACRKKWADEERAKIDESVKGLLALRDKAKAAKFKEEMEKLVLGTDQEKQEEEEEEEERDGEESEKSDNSSEPAGDDDNLETVDSEEVSHNGIIFPWDLNRDSVSRNRKGLAEGGRSLTSPSDVPEPQIIKEILKEDEIEKGALDNLIKEKEVAYGKYLKKTKEEILPNISHFDFGLKRAEQDEVKSLGNEIEEMLRIEKEELKKSMELNEKGRFENKKRLIQEIDVEEESEERATVTEKEESDKELVEEIKQITITEQDKNTVKTEVDDIIYKAINLINGKNSINEKKANEIIKNGVEIVKELNLIGELPLKAKETEDSSSESEFEDVEEELEVLGKKLEHQESEEYYSFIEDGKVSETNTPTKESSDETPQNTTENFIQIQRKNITSSIELQIVTENDN